MSIRCPLIVALLLISPAVFGQKTQKRSPRVAPLKKTEAPVVRIFEGMKAKQLGVRLVQRNEKSGTLFVKNMTRGDLVVEFPSSFVGVQVVNNQARAGNGRAGAAQSVAASITPPRSRAQAAPRGDGAATARVHFPVAADKTIQLPITSACLEYGRPEPNARLPYTIIPVEQYSKNPVFHELLPLFAKKKASQKIAQAAAWHLSSNLSWTELSGITVSPALPVPLFDAAMLQRAKALIDEATALARKKQAEKTKQSEK